MRIAIGGMELLSQEYRSFDDFVDELVDYENAHGRRVPDYDFGIMIGAVAMFLLERVANKVVDEALEWRRKRAQGELEEKRYSELMNKLDDLREAIQRAADAQPEPLTLAEHNASASALLKGMKKENVGIDIVLETEAEGDLKEAFEALTKDVPGSSVKD